MKQKWNKQAGALIKIACVAVIVAFSGITLVSFKAKQAYADLWSQLGIAKNDGTSNIKESFLSGYLQYYGVRNLKNIATADRAALAKDLLEYTRQYVQSDAFKKEYTTHREQVKPQEPRPARTIDDIRKENVESIKRSIGEVEKGLKTVEEKYKDMYLKNLEMLKKQLKEYEDPNNKMIKLIADSEQQQYEFQKKSYEEDVKKWEVKYPASSTAFVKARLQQMLDATADVDFNAQLTEKWGKKVFVNSAYERKNSNWKYAFRAGKEVTQTVRQFAEQWVKEIK